MKLTRSTWTIGLLFAVAHLALSLGIPMLLAGGDLQHPWVVHGTTWLMSALTLPLLFALHDPAMSMGTTVALIGANSAAAGVVVGLLHVALRHGRSKDRAGIALAGLALTILAGSSSAQGQREFNVGIPARITDLVLPGSEVEVRPQDAKTPVVLRITRVAPHGTDFRYDLEWTGLDVGRHDLRAFLRRKDGTDAANLPEIAVDVRSVLAPGMVKPNHPPEGDVPRFGGYRAWLIGLGVAWALGLVGILFLFRKKRVADHAARVRPRTLAERLRPLVESAMAGTLSSAERAQLELSLVAYWRRRRGLETARPDEALAALRRDEDAGPLLNQLDAWLYKRGTAESVDLATLLAPYKDLPPDALDTYVERS